MKSLRMSFSQSFTLALAMCLGLGINHGTASARTVEAPHFIYEIFTQSFADSNGDGIGDLKGVRSKLNYISSLGADAIWLTPIFESPSYHGYDVTDYYSIKKAYGTLADLKDLISNAHARGIKVLLDIPINHTSNQSAWFKEKNHYLWSNTPPYLPKQWYAAQGQYYFSSFSPSMPDLNFKNPDVLAQVESVFDYWTSQGIDGFRLDAAKFLIKGPRGEQNQPGTHDIWKKIAAHLNHRSYLIGEVWDSSAHIASYYGQGNELDAAFDFPVEGGLRSSLQNQNGKDFLGALSEKLKTQLNGDFAAPFAGNHDLDRLASALNNDLNAQKLAALAVFTLPGTPTVYYGDEIGMPDGNLNQFPGDLAKRTPMNWAAASTQARATGSLLSFYQAIARLRKSNAALRLGRLSHPQALGPTAVSFMREDASSGQRVLVVMNFGNLTVSPQTFTLAATSVSRLYGNANLSANANSTVSLSGLGPKQAVIFSIK